jgi:hypothetical protein
MGSTNAVPRLRTQRTLHPIQSVCIYCFVSSQDTEHAAEHPAPPPPPPPGPRPVAAATVRARRPRAARRKGLPRGREERARRSPATGDALLHGCVRGGCVLIYDRGVLVNVCTCLTAGEGRRADVRLWCCARESAHFNVCACANVSFATALLS